MSVETTTTAPPTDESGDGRTIGRWRRYLPYAIAFVAPFLLASIKVDLGFPWKTIVGIAAMALVKAHTLVLTTGRTSVGQWRREIVEKTNLTEADVGEYTGERKVLRPVTITTETVISMPPITIMFMPISACAAGAVRCTPST